MKKCKGARRDGAACGMPALADGDRCYVHDPRKKLARNASRAAGGKSRASQVARATAPAEERPDWFELKDHDDVESALRDVSQRLLSGRMGAREANAATTALRGLLRAIDAADDAEAAGN